MEQLPSIRSSNIAFVAGSPDVPKAVVEEKGNDPEDGWNEVDPKVGLEDAGTAADAAAAATAAAAN